jgi:hypothetical protein
MITGGRKYIISDNGSNAGIFCDIAKVPELYLDPGDDFIQSDGLAIGMMISFDDVDIPMTLCLTDNCAKNLIKALKATRKKYKKAARSKL